MYDCDKGYILAEKGPVGATCVGGLWRPTDLPLCLPGLHPRLRWTRRKRSLQMKATRSQYLLRNYRRLKRKIDELLQYANVEPIYDKIMRSKRNHQRIYNNPAHNQWHAIATALVRFKRNNQRDEKSPFARTVGSSMNREQRNRHDHLDEAITKHFEKIKQKHRNYISNLSRASHHIAKNASDHYDSTHGHINEQRHEIHSLIHRPIIDKQNKNEPYLPINSHEPSNTNLFQEINAFASFPIPLPNINENMNSPNFKKEKNNSPFVNNTYVGHDWKQRLRQESNDNLVNLHNQNNASDIIAQLTSQIIQRKKRSVDSQNALGKDDQKRQGNRKNGRQINLNDTSLPQQDDEVREENSETNKKTRSKEPCEVSLTKYLTHVKMQDSILIIFCVFFLSQAILMEPYIRIDIVREGKDPSNEFSTGTIVRATCAKEYRLNLQNPNGTAKCVRGRWKPLKPTCTMIPCSVPSTERGTYSAIIIDPNDEKPSTRPLNAFDEVHHDEIVDFVCDEGYNVQGAAQLKCIESSWDVAGLPECVPAPCSLPTISNAVYQVNLFQFTIFSCFFLAIILLILMNR